MSTWIPVDSERHRVNLNVALILNGQKIVKIEPDSMTWLKNLTQGRCTDDVCHYLCLYFLFLFLISHRKVLSTQKGTGHTERYWAHRKVLGTQKGTGYRTLETYLVSLSKKLYPCCSVLVGSRNGFERDITIELK